MNLKQLHYFCEVVASGSAAQAAKKLFVAPTAVSMSLSQLESELGGQLFDRASRPMPLTSLGQFLLPRAQELLGLADRLRGDAKRVAASRQGWLGIGFTRSVMLSVLPAAVRRFSAQYPDVRLEMVELLSEHQPAQMAAGKVHIGISRFVEPVSAPAGFRAEALFQEALLAALPVARAPAAGTPITLAELARQPFVSYPRDPKTRYARQILAAAERLGSPLNVQHEAVEIHTALGLVSAGLGATLVGASVALQPRADVSFHPVDGLDVRSTVAAILPDDEHDAFVPAFVHAMRLAAQDLGIPVLAQDQRAA